MALLLLPGVLAVVYALGAFLLRLLGVSFGSRLQRWVFALGGGTGALGVVVFLCGVARWYGAWTPWVLAAACLVLGYNSWRVWPDDLAAWARRVGQMRRHKGHLALLSLCAVLGAMNLLGAAAPTTDADTMAYHFSVPQKYIDAGGFFYSPNFEANIALGMHMVHLFNLMVGGEVLAALFSTVQPMVLALAVVAFGQRYFSLTAGLLAGTLLYTTPLVTSLTGTGTVDAALALFTFLAFWALVEWEGGAGHAWLLLSGVCMGFALGVKYYGLISLLVLGLLSLWCARGAGVRSWKGALGASLLWGLAALAVGCPSYIKNAIYTGNPLYPAFYALLGGRDWSQELAASMKVIAATKRAAGDHPLALLTVPWQMTMDGDRFLAGRNGYGPLFLAFAPLIGCLFAGGARRRLLLLMGVFAVAFYAMWFFFAFHRGRHLLPIMPMVSLYVAAGTVVALAAVPHWGRYVLTFFMVVGLLFHSGVNALYNIQFFPVVFGGESKEDFLVSKSWYYPDVLWMNENLDENAKVLHFYRTMNHRLKVDHYFASIFFQGGIDWANTREAAALLPQLRRMGITHVVVDMQMNKLYDEPNPASDRTYNNMIASMRQTVDCCVEEVYRDRRQVAAFRTFGGRQMRAIEPVVFRLDWEAAAAFGGWDGAVKARGR